jgi:hypothetical protein
MSVSPAPENSKERFRFVAPMYVLDDRRPVQVVLLLLQILAGDARTIIRS